MKVLITGGSGLLGIELVRIAPKNFTLDDNLLAPPRGEVDITNINEVESFLVQHDIDVVLHAAAMTRPMKDHEINPGKSIQENIIGTANIAYLCSQLDTRMIYISTDYVYLGDFPLSTEEDPVLPVNFYATSKLGGECAVKMLDNFLILRCSFCPRPFPHKKAFNDVYKSYLYVDEIAPIIWKFISSTAMGIYNVGGSRMTVYEFAKRSDPNVDPISRNEAMAQLREYIPVDTSMNLRKLDNILVDVILGVANDPSV